MNLETFAQRAPLHIENTKELMMLCRLGHIRDELFTVLDKECQSFETNTNVSVQDYIKSLKKMRSAIETIVADDAQAGIDRTTNRNRELDLMIENKSQTKN